MQMVTEAAMSTCREEEMNQCVHYVNALQWSFCREDRRRSLAGRDARFVYGAEQEYKYPERKRATVRTAPEPSTNSMHPVLSSMTAFDCVVLCRGFASSVCAFSSHPGAFRAAASGGYRAALLFGARTTRSRCILSLRKLVHVKGLCFGLLATPEAPNEYAPRRIKV